ncbi:MAG TPA: apolipoprotein N-acyltransferase [Terriglobales bacterium]|nr:apolipoprotein N-acyltransferase [Terriglobales bacterium]
MRTIESRAWLLAITSAVLQVLIFPLPNLYVLCWIAVAPVLVALIRTRRPDTLQLQGAVKLLPATPLQGFVLGYACGILWYGGNCYWVYSTMKQYGGISAPGAFGLLVLFCLYLGLYHGAFGLIIALLAKWSQRMALVLSPMVWVAVELARTRISGFPWDLLGTVQADNIPLAKISTVTGVYGVSLEIMIVNAAFAAAFLIQRSRRRSLLLAAVAAAVLLQIPRWFPAPKFPTDRAALLVQENVPVLDGSDWTRQYFDDTLTDLTKLSLSPPGGEPQHPDLIVWPESPAPFYSGDPLFRTALSHIATTAHEWVVAGSIGVENATVSPQQPTRIYNSAVLVSPSGDWIARYDKIHLVPFGEYVPFKDWLSFAGGLTKEVGDFSRGHSRWPLQAGDERLGIFICYESVFPDEVRQFSDKGAQVFVNISNDGWYGDSGAYAQHLKQARMRAIENERWLLRATNTGVTAAIDPDGRVAQTVPRKIRTALDASYALMDSKTFYTRHGDWLAYLCAIISVVAIFIAVTPLKGRLKA